MDVEKFIIGLICIGLGTVFIIYFNDKGFFAKDAVKSAGTRRIIVAAALSLLGGLYLIISSFV